MFARHSSSVFILHLLIFEIDVLFRDVLHVYFLLNVFAHFFVLNGDVDHLWSLLTSRCFRLDDRQLDIFTYHWTSHQLNLLMSCERLQVMLVAVAHWRLQVVFGLLKHLRLRNIMIRHVLIWLNLLSFRSLSHGIFW